MASGPEGTGFGATDVSAASAGEQPSAPPPRRATVELIDEDDVGCTGKKKKKQPRESKRRPTAAGSNGDQEAPAAAESGSPRPPDLNYPVPPPGSMTDGDCMCAPPPCCYRKRVGNMYVCCEQRTNGTPRIVCGWPACWAMQCFTQALVWGVGAPVFYFSFPSHEPWVWVLGSTLLALTSLSLFCVGTSDPGVLPLYRPPGDDHLQKPGPEVPGHRWTHYPRAGEDAWVLVPDSTRTTWCSESGILVRDYDHFCPWTGTTIAGGNMCCFHLFIYSLCAACIFVVFVGITAAGVAAEEAAQRQSTGG